MGPRQAAHNANMSYSGDALAWASPTMTSAAHVCLQNCVEHLKDEPELMLTRSDSTHGWPDRSRVETHHKLQDHRLETGISEK